MDGDWEIHGPHLEVPIVYVGYALYDKWRPNLNISEKNRLEGTYVAIYPKAVYEVEEPEDWYKVSPEQRIDCFKRRIVI